MMLLPDREKSVTICQFVEELDGQMDRRTENRTKIANFPTPVYLTPPLKGFPLELGKKLE